MTVQRKGAVTRASNMNQNSLQMVKGAPHQELAWSWIKYVTNGENMERFAQITGRLPAYLPVLQRYNRYVANPPANLMKAVVDLVMDPNAFHAPIGAKAAAVLKLIDTNILLPARNGKPNPIQSTLEELQRQATDILTS